MELLKKIWSVFSGVLRKKSIAIKQDQAKQTVNIKGDNNNTTIAGPYSNVRVGADIRASEEEPLDQDTGGMWFREV